MRIDDGNNPAATLDEQANGPVEVDMLKLSTRDDGGRFVRCLSAADENTEPEEVTTMARLRKNSNRWVTVASTYPVGGNKAWLSFNSSASTRYGVASNISGGWEASGAKSSTDGWGFDSNPFSLPRMHDWARHVLRRARLGIHTSTRKQCVVLAVLTCAALLSACSVWSGPREHEEGEGPLSANVEGGGVTADAPKKTPWYTSNGGYLLCAQKPGKRLTIQNVRYDVRVRPVEITPYLHDVSPEEDNSNTLGVGWVRGKPPDFDTDEYTTRKDDRVPGTFTRKVEGREITQTCEEMDKLGTGYTELVIVTKNDERGSYIPGMSIHYTDENDREYILDLHWEMAACGTALPDRIANDCG